MTHDLTAERVRDLIGKAITEDLVARICEEVEGELLRDGFHGPDDCYCSEDSCDYVAELAVMKNTVDLIHVHNYRHPGPVRVCDQMPCLMFRSHM